MKKGFALIGMFYFVFLSCAQDKLHFEPGDLKITVETGEHWLHDFPLFLGIKVKNPPQFAIWITDLDTNYIGTLFCTHKIATEGWMANKGNRRKEALPVWCHSRGVRAEDGLYLPTRESPLPDGITGATPKKNYTLLLKPEVGSRFLVFAEFNHSTDFNTFYPKDAPAGTSNYSGGEEGSGEPAVVYSAGIDLTSPDTEWILEYQGHASPDGSNGNIYPGTEGLDQALSIVKRITISR